MHPESLIEMKARVEERVAPVFEARPTWPRIPHCRIDPAAGSGSFDAP